LDQYYVYRDLIDKRAFASTRATATNAIDIAGLRIDGQHDQLNLFHC